jgi:hypothetical protein
MALCIKAKSLGPESQGTTFPLLSGKRAFGEAPHKPNQKLLGRPNVSASLPTRRKSTGVAVPRVSRSARSPDTRKSGGGAEIQLDLEVARAHAAAVERAVKSLQKQRQLQKQSEEEAMRDKQMRAAKIDAKNQERKRYRAEIYAINKFLKEQEQLRFEAMLENLANGDPCGQVCESGDDSSLSNGSADEGEQKGSQRKEEDKRKEKGKISFGV